MIITFFITYSFLGWVFESTYVSLKERLLTNRGFLHGPVCPIYGFGAVAMLLVLQPFDASPLLVFALGLIVADTLEYIVSVLLEKAFGARWWDYSHHRFNLNGRISLSTSLAWGVLALFLVYLLHPALLHLYEAIPDTTVSIGLIIALSIFALDIGWSISEALDLKKGINDLKQHYDDLIERRDTLVEDLIDRSESNVSRAGLAGIKQLEATKGRIEDIREDVSSLITKDTPAHIRSGLSDIQEGISQQLKEIEILQSRTARRFFRSFPNLQKDVRTKQDQFSGIWEDIVDRLRKK